MIQTKIYRIFEHVQFFSIMKAQDGWDKSHTFSKKELDKIFNGKFNSQHIYNLSDSDIDNMCNKLLKLKAFL